MPTTHTDWPGQELRPEYRNVCRLLVRDQGWRYKRGSNHPVLVPPDRDQSQVPVPCTPSEYRGWQNWLRDLRVRGADLSPATPVRRQTVAPFSHAAPVVTVAENFTGQSKREWWASIGGEDWWRYRYGDEEVPQPAKPEPSPAVTSMLAKLKPKRPVIDMDCKKRNPAYSLRDVRRMVREGYSLTQVVERTGWGAFWIADMVGPDGYYLEEMGTG